MQMGLVGAKVRFEGRISLMWVFEPPSAVAVILKVSTGRPCKPDSTLSGNNELSLPSDRNPQSQGEHLNPLD